MLNPIKVAACQLPEVLEDVDHALDLIETYALRAEAASVKLVCFPECIPCRVSD